MKVLLISADGLEADCASVALEGAGVATTAEPGPDIEAVVWLVAPGATSEMMCALYDDPDGPPLLLISPHLDTASQRLARDLGAAALLSWDTSSRMLAATIDQVVQGGYELAVAEDPVDPENPLRDLTGRELEIVGLLGEGASNADIARTLGISYHTARTHVAHVLSKLGVSHRYAVVALTRGRSHRQPALAASGREAGP